MKLAPLTDEDYERAANLQRAGDLPQSFNMQAVPMLDRVEHRLNIAAHNAPMLSYESEHYQTAWEWLIIRISYVPGAERSRIYEHYLPWVPEKAK